MTCILQCPRSLRFRWENLRDGRAGTRRRGHFDRWHGASRWWTTGRRCDARSCHGVLVTWKVWFWCTAKRGTTRDRLFALACDSVSKDGSGNICGVRLWGGEAPEESAMFCGAIMVCEVRSIDWRHGGVMLYGAIVVCEVTIEDMGSQGGSWCSWCYDAWSK